ncbi:DNA binding domain-containing protein, excisionase family [Limimonas halophila]|uniref:DNA binding domain-containing protein, excisionase family n=1 Tax=Limimonas halophila TaxID=1082479 RepID=A0A1G7M153_9PROT|nr:helix-turn-helix transcriptional regulator [Limimonas halophila]SDF55381.1 DNA binding domain-containing protein, excisionase family [Limimonas halophila]
MNAYLTTREVAAYLRITERRVYELVRQRAIPCTRATGKWLFPRPMVDRWLVEQLEGPDPGAARPANVLAGSHDPLLSWAVRASESGLALMPGGSTDGLRQVEQGRAAAAGLHLHDPDSGDFNVHAVRTSAAVRGCVLLTWAWRRQGLVLPAGNPDGVTGLADVVERGLPLARRQADSGSGLLLGRMLADLGYSVDAPRFVEDTAHGETEVGMAVLQGRARAGLAVEAAARGLGLGFVPLTWERFDLLLDRRAAFEPPLQALFAFARSAGFRAEATRLGGYDIASLGTVQVNGP